MNPEWEPVSLGRVLKRVERFESRDDFKEYPFAGTYSFARGIFVAERKLGTSFKLPKVQRLKTGDFVYCKIMAWEGAFGTVPPKANDCVMSGAFVVYEHVESIVDSRFLDWYFRAPSNWQRVGRQSTGTNVRRQSLHPDQFEASEIRLPPLTEQRRIVARIEELAAKIREAQTLRGNLKEHILALPRGLLHQRPSTRMIRVGDFATPRPPDVKVEPLEEYHFAGVYCFGRGVFRGQRKLGSEFAYPKLTRLHAGNFVYPKLMAWEGALGIVPADCDGLMVSTEYPVFEIDTEAMLPEVIDTYFRSPEVWPGLSGQSGGTNVRRRRLNPNDFLNLRVPWPDQETQSAIKQCVSRVSAIRAIQSETAVELDAMLPSILDKAFKGGL
jgi:type I restriction enzyme, S subunit